MRSAPFLFAFVAAVFMASTAQAQNVFAPIPGTTGTSFAEVGPPPSSFNVNGYADYYRQSPGNRSCTNGTAWQYVVPAGVRWVRITATGGRGAPGDQGGTLFAFVPHMPSMILNATTPSAGGPGLGATVRGIVPVTPGQTLYVVPASNGGRSSPSSGWGFPGGGVGFGNGGGASLVSTVAAYKPNNEDWCFVPPQNLLVVAGGGGGPAHAEVTSGAYGGSAGLISGVAGSGGNGGGAMPGTGGGGGSQTSGGGVGSHPGCGSEARFAGDYLRGSFTNGFGGAGGGGYFGGGAGGGGDCVLNSGAGGGGGGSSWITNTAQEVQSALDGAGLPGVVIEPMSVSYPMNVAITGPGTVTSTDATLSCAKAACTANEAENASITFTAVPAANNAFQGWAGDCASAGMSLTCTLKSGPLVGSPGGGFYPRTAAARFGAIPLYQLSVSFASSNAANTSMPLKYGTTTTTVAANQTVTVQLPANTPIQLGGMMMTSPYQLQAGPNTSSGKLPLAFPLTAATNVSVTSTLWQP